MSRVSRRGVIIGSAVAVGAAAIGGGVVALNRTASSRTSAARRLFAGSEQQAETPGDLFVEAVPDDPVVSDPDGVPPGAVPPETREPLEWFTEAPVAELASQSSTGCRSDFSEDRVVELHGWVLPLTAAQLCAITGAG